MKRCSTCNRTYTDPNLRFCIDDGTPLATVQTDDETTVVRPQGNEDDEWNTGGYQPPSSSYIPPGAEPVKRQRRVWPWIVGIGGAFLLGIVAISIAAAILVPRMMRARQNERAGVGQPRNANTAPETSNANSNATENVNTPPPTDREQENEWTVANLNADKKKLDRILADDYVGQSGEGGGLESKTEYIRTIQRDTQVEKWEFSDLKLTLAGDRATLSGIITYFTRERVVSFDFRDKFVWRDGRWQATGAELKARGNQGTEL